MNVIELLQDAYEELAKSAATEEDAEYYRDKARELDSTKANAEEVKKKAELTPMEQDIQSSQNKLNEIADQAQQIQRKLGDSSMFITPEMYKEAIDNASNYIDELTNQIGIYQGEMDKIKQDNPEDYFNNTDYQKYLEAVRSLNKEVWNQVDAQKEWKKAIDQFDVTKLAKDIDTYNRALKQLNNEKAINDSLGLYRTEEDIQRDTRLQQNIYNAATQTANDLSDELYIKINVSGEIEAGSKEEADLQNQIQSYQDQAT